MPSVRTLSSLAPAARPGVLGALTTFLVLPLALLGVSTTAPTASAAEIDVPADGVTFALAGPITVTAESPQTLEVVATRLFDVHVGVSP